jgi:hypothetical protein
LQNSNVKCLYFRDRDNNEPVVITRADIIKTRKREIENYIPISIIENKFNVHFSQSDKENWVNIDVAETLYTMGLRFGNNTDPQKQKKDTENTIKNILESKEVWETITFSDTDTAEIIEWFNKMKQFFE